MSTLFARRTQVIIANKTLESPILTIHFDLPFSDDKKENVGNITIYNLSDETINLLTKDAYLILKSGYQGDVGNISNFTIKEANTRIEGIDRVTKITVGEEDGRWKNALINKTWMSNALASKVITDICNGIGVTIGALTLPIDMQYPRGKSFSKAAKLCLQELVADCQAKMTFTRGIIYIRPPQHGTQTGFILNKYSGLIGSPEKIANDEGEEGYKVISLMNYKIEVGSIIKLESRTVNGIFRVKKGVYKSDESDHIVEMEVVPA